MLASRFKNDDYRRGRVVRWLDAGANRVLAALGETVVRSRALRPVWRNGDVAPVAPPGQNPVLVIHGYGADVGSLAFLVRLLREDGFTAREIDLDTVHHRVEDLAWALGRRVETFRRVHEAERVDLIGHSLGGVLARYYIQMLGGHEHVDRVITIGSPHRDGTWAMHLTTALRWSGLYPFPREDSCAQQLMPRSAFYERLNGPEYRVENLQKVDFTSIYSHADSLIIPQRNAHLPGVRNIAFWRYGHVGLVMSPRVYRTVRERLLAPKR